MLNFDSYMTIFETIQPCTKKSSDSFKDAINKMCLQIIYIYIYIKRIWS